MNAAPLALRGKRVLLIGLGARKGGVGVARYLVEQGAEVRVTDLRSADQLAASLADLNGLPIGWTIGEHREDDIDWADIVVRNPAVPASSPWLARARAQGKPVEMEMSLFFRACPAPIIGVTGTKGKTTTTTLLHAMLREHWPDAVLAGNMGVSALAQLPDLRADVPIVLELSSFQLEGLDEHRLAPHVAVLTNIAPDHLDRYDSFEAYAATKASIFRWQTPRVDFAVFDPGDPRVKELTNAAPGQWVLFGSGYRPGLYPDVWVEDGEFWAAWEHEPVSLGRVDALKIPGEHAQRNALAAAAAALTVGVTEAEIRRAIAGFTGVTHRLEPIATINGVTWVNDSAATAPSAAVAALRAYADRGIVAISGGYDKRLAMDTVADELARSARAVVLLDGTVTPLLTELLAARGVQPVGDPATSMDEAVARAASVARPGDVVLLSPGCASFGLFRDEFHRGDAFREAVEQLAGDAS